MHSYLSQLRLAQPEFGVFPSQVFEINIMSWSIMPYDKYILKQGPCKGKILMKTSAI